MLSTRENQQQGAGDGLPNHDVLLAHAIVGALTAMLFIPITILLPRIARGFSLNRWWFPVHASSATAALLCGIATVALANIGLGSAQSHGVSLLCTSVLSADVYSLGYALVAFLIAQAVLGPFMKWFNYKHPRPASQSRNPLNYVHMVLGITTLAVGWAAVYTGWSDQWPENSGTGSIATVWKVLYWVVVGVVAFFYIGGWILLWPRQRRMESAMKQVDPSPATPTIPLVSSSHVPVSHQPTSNSNGAY